MREIKFRAWDELNEEMCKVYQIRSFEGNCHYILDNPNTDVFGNHYGANNTWCKIMQYTGLKDKNGKEIYDGDIIKYSNFPMYGECKEFISRVNITPFGIIIKSDCGNELYLAKCFEKCEVIGNIYANPELLEVEPNDK